MMNQRIRTLMDQAVSFRLDPDSMSYEAQVSPDDLAAFAELIVQECASMARVYCSHEFDFTGDLELDEFMLKHFGVES
jgi:hypothetical protein